MEEDSSGHTQPSFAPPPRRRAMRTARADRGEMPPEIESVFESARVSLFPSRLSELQTECSCPDWSNPCKHIAAVYYLLGEEFDRDPFLAFRLRGITRDELLRVVEELGDDARPSRARRGGGGKDAAPATTATGATTASFWRPGELPDDLPPEPLPPAQAGALLTRLGPFPFWRGKEPLPDA